MKLENKVVGYAFVSGDLFHYGHLHFIKECKKHCDFLIVGVQTDPVISSYKRHPVIPFHERIAIFGAVREVDLVVPQDSRDTVPTMKKLVEDGYDIKVLFHGTDWKEVFGTKWIRKRGGKLMQPEYFEEQTTTKIIEKIKKEKELGKIKERCKPFKVEEGPFKEDYEKLYGFVDYKDKVILDIGADWGSTALFFIKKGAKRIIAVEGEKKYIKILREIAKTEKKIFVVPGWAKFGYNIANWIKWYEPDLVKIDCDGCEVILLQMINEDIRLVKEWLMELHSINVLKGIRALFERNGFKVKYCKIDQKSQWAWIVHFVREVD